MKVALAMTIIVFSSFYLGSMTMEYLSRPVVVDLGGLTIIRKSERIPIVIIPARREFSI